MINSIHIAKFASYGSVPEIMDGLSQFNYIFGSNGTGKTTISKIIDDESVSPFCTVNWKSGTKLQTLVYNEDFVKQNFDQSIELKGVFTLGEESVDTLKKIADAKREQDELTKKIETLSLNTEGEDGKGGKKGELAELEKELKSKCWVQKQKHDEKLKGAFEGYRNSAERFKNKVFQELKDNVASLLPIADIEKKAETVFGPTPTIEKVIPRINAEALINHEKNLILEKRVIGKEDVDIAAMIKKLDNSDWVRQGRVFYDTSTKICPFCQQGTMEELAQSLNEYFDDAFETDSKTIDDLVMNYKDDSVRLQQAIDSIIEAQSKFLDFEKVKNEKQLLDSRLHVNELRLAAKKNEPSRVVELESIINIVTNIKGLISDANSHITEHNKMVENLSQEQKELTMQVWKYLLENELKKDLETYKNKKNGLDKAITSMTYQKVAAEKNRDEKKEEIRKLEKQTTSIQPTKDGINAILSKFGFQGFSLAEADNGISYKLVRADGSDAKETLSEGERSFVMFLYFYQLLKGSQAESEIKTDRVVVFDDPVSSLDCDVLFVVNSLIKGLFDEVRARTGHIKQVFVLTHNVYFHREITFNPRRTNDAMTEETFWVVRKSGMESKLIKHNSNPIKTSYELLWAEVRNPDRSNLTIQNTLRRILEYYFTILGRFDYNYICNKFDGQDKLICRSLFAWVNAGSHFPGDDLYVSQDGTPVDTYLKVFRAVFEKTDHPAHYRMMMGDAYEEKTNEEAEVL